MNSNFARIDWKIVTLGEGLKLFFCFLSLAIIADFGFSFSWLELTFLHYRCGI